MSEIATAVAAAVEQQGAATHEVARKIQQSAQGIGEVSAGVVQVRRGPAETRQRIGSTPVVCQAAATRFDAAQTRGRAFPAHHSGVTCAPHCAGRTPGSSSSGCRSCRQCLARALVHRLGGGQASKPLQRDRLRAVFFAAVPELTRCSSIKLNARLKLRRSCHNR